MAGHGEKLTRKQEQAVAALLEHTSLARAGAAVGVSEKTLRRWLKEPRFREAFGEARRRLLDDAVRALQRGAAAAVAALLRELGAAKSADVIRAAVAVLDRAFAGTQLMDLEERLAALERLMKERQRGT